MKLIIEKSERERERRIQIHAVSLSSLKIIGFLLQQSQAESNWNVLKFSYIL